jgi:hypothetical protein
MALTQNGLKRHSRVNIQNLNVAYIKVNEHHVTLVDSNF